MTQLKVSCQLPTMSSDNDSITPADGQTVRIYGGDIQIPEDGDVSVRLVWDYGGADEILWVWQSSSKVEPGLFDIITGDGSKQLALIIQNNTLGSKYVAGALLYNLD